MPAYTFHTKFAILTKFKIPWYWYLPVSAPVKLVLWSYATVQGWDFSLSFNIFNIGSFGIPCRHTEAFIKMWFSLQRTAVPRETNYKVENLLWKCVWLTWKADSGERAKNLLQKRAGLDLSVSWDPATVRRNPKNLGQLSQASRCLFGKGLDCTGIVRHISKEARKEALARAGTELGGRACTQPQDLSQCQKKGQEKRKQEWKGSQLTSTVNMCAYVSLCMYMCGVGYSQRPEEDITFPNHLTCVLDLQLTKCS